MKLQFSKFLSSVKAGHLFFLGFFILFLSLIPTILLGTDSVVYYHDQLDGELIAYIYQAKYLFSGSDIIPEFLNGATKTTLTPPAPLVTLLFVLFSPFTGYTILQFGVQLVAYAGMFLLVNRITQQKVISFTIALLYTFLPLLPVYGLTQYGIPLLLLCFWNLHEGRHRIVSRLYVILYALTSSLILFGFVWIILGVFLAAYAVFKREFSKWKSVLTAFLLLFLIYIAENFSLITQILGINGGFASHKEDYVLDSFSLGTQFWEYLASNTSHSTDHHLWILLLLPCTLLYFFLCRRRRTQKESFLFRLLMADIFFILVLCLAAALWTIPFTVSLREQFGALKSFNFSRVLWCTPTLWYLALALCLSLLHTLSSKERALAKYPAYLYALGCLGILSICCLKTSFLKPNVQKLLMPDYDTITWSDYYALGVMEQVEEFLLATGGLQMEEYKVASLGIDPAAALYHGFYCIDGYSNNYPLSYKKAFREAIAPELAKSDYLKTYFDDWGNRCYLFSAEIPGYYNVEKGSFWYNSLELNTSALKALGCDYILSAAYIVSAENMNLTLLREEPFETPDSYYRIYLYKINS